MDTDLSVIMVAEKRKVNKQNAKTVGRRAIKQRLTTKRGDGIIDKVIDKIPFEMHVPGYQYCGPGIHISIIHLEC